MQYREGSKSVGFLCNTETGLKVWAPCVVQRRV